MRGGRLIKCQNVSFAAKNLKAAAAQDIVPRSVETQSFIKTNMLESVSASYASSAIIRKVTSGTLIVSVIVEIPVP